MELFIAGVIIGSAITLVGIGLLNSTSMYEKQVEAYNEGYNDAKKEERR